MTNLIDRDALESFYESGTDPNDTYADMTFIRVEHIENAPTVNRWISCNERLPEDDENVLVYILTSHMNFISLAHIHKGVFRSAWNHDKITNVEITHWMPLPETPKGVIPC